MAQCLWMGNQYFKRWMQVYHDYLSIHYDTIEDIQNQKLYFSTFLFRIVFKYLALYQCDSCVKNLTLMFFAISNLYTPLENK